MILDVFSFEQCQQFSTLFNNFNQSHEKLVQPWVLHSRDASLFDLRD